MSDAQGCIDTIVSTSQPSQLIVFSATVTSNYNLEDISVMGKNDGALQASSTGEIQFYDYFEQQF